MNEDETLLFRQQVAIAREKNRVANGRLFNVLMFALVLFMASQIDKGALWLAFFPALSVGAAYLQDSSPGALGRRLPAISTVAAVVPLLSIFYI
ncbi:hypothetical protein [Rhizobium sp.]|uniref:hypothetical protein n=1 Tax=Rhizobium sp. TaxID=391 RepID=UPI0028B23889